MYRKYNHQRSRYGFKLTGLYFILLCTMVNYIVLFGLLIFIHITTTKVTLFRKSTNFAYNWNFILKSTKGFNIQQNPFYSMC